MEWAPYAPRAGDTRFGPDSFQNSRELVAKPGSAPELDAHRPQAVALLLECSLVCAQAFDVAL